MSTTSTFRLAIAAALSTLWVPAASAAKLEPPAGFDIRTIGKSEPVIAMEHLTLDYAPIAVRQGMERICKASFDAGASRRMPVFEPGMDEPVRTRNHTLISLDFARMAVYIRTDSYRCDEAELKAAGACGCTYRRQTAFRLNIHKASGASYQRWEADLSRKRGRLYANDPMPSLLRPKAFEPDDFSAMAGVVVGHEQVAGLACEVRHHETPTARVDACMSLRDKKLPIPLWDRNLRGTVYGFDKTSKTWKLALSGEMQASSASIEVDSGVFDAPTGIVYSSSGASAEKAEKAEKGKP